MLTNYLLRKIEVRILKADYSLTSKIEVRKNFEFRIFSKCFTRNAEAYNFQVVLWLIRIFLDFNMFSLQKQLFRILQLQLAGHFKVPCGPDVARGPDVAQACSMLYAQCSMLYALCSMLYAHTHPHMPKPSSKKFLRLYMALLTIFRSGFLDDFLWLC